MPLKKNNPGCNCCGCDCTSGLLFTRFSSIDMTMDGPRAFNTHFVDTVDDCGMEKNWLRCDADYPLVFPDIGNNGSIGLPSAAGCYGNEVGYFLNRFRNYGLNCDLVAGNTYYWTDRAGISANVHQACNSSGSLVYNWSVSLSYTYQARNDDCDSSYPVPFLPSPGVDWTASELNPYSPTSAGTIWRKTGTGGEQYELIQQFNNTYGYGFWNRSTFYTVTISYSGTSADVNDIPDTYDLTPLYNTLGYTGTVTFL